MATAAPANVRVPSRRSFGETLSNALIVTRREVRDSFRDWRILSPIIILTFLFPSLAQFVAGEFTGFVTQYGADIIGERTIPFLLMIVGFFPISISMVIALETFVGEKERRSLEPLLSTPLTNTELYIGKTLAAMIPPLVSSLGGMFVYLSSLVFGELSWRPQPALIFQIVLLTSVQALVMVTGAVVVSSQTTSTRAANLLASFIIIPMTLVIQGESAIMFLAPDAESPNGIGALWAIIVGMIVVVALLLRVGNSVFNREEILGRTIDQINLKAMFNRVWRSILAVDDAGTPARNLREWLTLGVGLTLRRLRYPIVITIIVFLVAFLGGLVFGLTSNFRMPRLMDPALNTGNIAENLALFKTAGPAWIVVQNGRILFGAAVLGLFTFGVGALVLTPVVYVVIGFILAQLIATGINPAFMAPALLTHGIIEIPIIVLATAMGLRLGAVMTRPPYPQTVGQALSNALADAVRLWVAVIIPGLILAALIEAYITPQVVAAFLGV